MENTVHEEQGTLMGENRNSKFYIVFMVTLEVNRIFAKSEVGQGIWENSPFRS